MLEKDFRLSKRPLFHLCILLIGFVPVISSANSLNAVINKTIQTNPTVLSYKQNRLSLDYVVDQSRADYFPRIKATGSYGPQKSTNSNTISAAQTGADQTVTMPAAAAGISLDQNIFAGFETMGEVLRNKARTNAAAYQLLASIQDVAYDSAEAYIDVLRGNALVELAQKNLAAHANLLNMIKLRTKAGLSNNADYIQAQGRWALARSQLLSEQNNRQDAISRYLRVTGDYPVDLSTPRLILASELPKTAKNAVAYAIRNNPVVRSAQADILQAREQHVVANSTNYPRLDLKVNVDRNRNQAGVRGPAYNDSAFLQVSYDLFAGGAQVARQSETVHLLDQSYDIFYNAIRQSRESTKIAWNLYETSRSVLPFLKENRNAAINTVIAYKNQYQLGKRTLFDLLNVQNEVYNSSRQYIDGQFKFLLSEYGLLHSMGSLVQTLGMPLPKETKLYQVPCCQKSTS